MPRKSIGTPDAHLTPVERTERVEVNGARDAPIRCRQFFQPTRTTGGGIQRPSFNPSPSPDRIRKPTSPVRRIAHIVGSASHRSGLCREDACARNRVPQSGSIRSPVQDPRDLVLKTSQRLSAGRIHDRRFGILEPLREDIDILHMVFPDRDVAIGQPAKHGSVRRCLGSPRG